MQAWSIYADNPRKNRWVLHSTRICWSGSLRFRLAKTKQNQPPHPTNTCQKSSYEECAYAQSIIKGLGTCLSGPHIHKRLQLIGGCCILFTVYSSWTRTATVYVCRKQYLSAYCMCVHMYIYIYILCVCCEYVCVYGYMLHIQYNIISSYPNQALSLSLYICII